jgi:HK97 family phage portal protein
MGLKQFFGNLASLARGAVLTRETVQTMTSTQLAAQSALTGAISQQLQVAGSSRPAENVILAYACITTRRDAIASAPIMITDAEEKAIESGPVYELFQKPNAENDWDRYVRILETHMTLYNIIAILPVGAPGAEPDELVPLHPAGLRADIAVHEPSGTPRVWKWRYIDPVTGAQKEFERDEVIIQMGYNPHAPMAALSPVIVLDRSIKTDICAREQNLGLFLNDATPKGYLHSDQMMNKDQALEALSVWNDAQRGYLNRHKTAALFGGLKHDRVQLSPQELEFLESLKSMRIDFYMAFRLYPAMLADMTGETGLSQGNSTESQRVAWWEDVGIPELKLIASLHQQIADRFSGSGSLRIGRSLSRTERYSLARKRRPRSTPTFIWFNDSAIPSLSRNRLAKVDADTKLCALGYKPDEMSEFLDLGLPPHPDNIGRVAFSTTTIGEGAIPEGTTTKSTKETQGAQKEKEPDPLARLDRIEQLVRAAGPKRTASVRRALDQFVGPREKTAAKRWSRFYVEQRGRVLARMDELKRADIVRSAEDDLLGRIFPRSVEDPQLIARLSPLWAEHLADGVKFFATETGIKVSNSLMIAEEPRLQEALAARTIQGLKVNATTEEDLRGILSKGFEAGASTAEIGDSIAEYYKDNCVGEMSARAQTAARTQTSGIVNDGRMIAARDVGGLKKFWIHGSPKEPRESHLAAAQQYDEAHALELDEPFIVDGEEMDSPGDAGASSENVCNCTCGLGFTKGLMGQGEAA